MLKSPNEHLRGFRIRFANVQFKEMRDAAEHLKAAVNQEMVAALKSWLGELVTGLLA